MDEQILQQLNHLCREFTAVEMAALALSSRWLGFGFIAFVVLALARRWRPRWLLVLVFVLVVVVTDALGHYVLKPLVARPRPCHVTASLHTPAGCGGPWSMPSNHAANAFAGATAAALLAPAGAPLFFSVAIGVALSRVFLGVHYLSDVLAGAALGTVVGLLGVWPAWRWLRRRSGFRLAA